MRSFFVTAQAVASVASSVRGVRTSSTSGRTATGLKKCMPTTRSGCSRSAPISVTESDDVFVASTHSGETTRSSSAKTSFLTAISSNTASRTRSQPAKTSHSVPPETSEPRKRALPSPRRPFASRGRRARRAIHAIAVVDLLLRQVAEDDRHLEPAEREQRELAGHEPGADDADASGRVRGSASGMPTPRFARRSTRLKA